jgi:hypothetical protein
MASLLRLMIPDTCWPAVVNDSDRGVCSNGDIAKDFGHDFGTPGPQGLSVNDRETSVHSP